MIMKKEKTYSRAPLPFVGQKRMFVSEFKKILKHFDDKTIFVDLFGGSGLLSHITKRERPDAVVIYNDHDNYRERLENIDRTNTLLRDLRKIVGIYPRHQKITGKMREAFLERIRLEETTGFVDYLTLSLLPYCFPENTHKTWRNLKDCIFITRYASLTTGVTAIWTGLR